MQGSGHGPVTLRLFQADAEHSVLEMGIDYGKAEVPERSYYADYCEVREARLGYSLVFAKLIPGSRRLRTKVEVAFPAEMFRLQLWGGSREFHKTVQRLAGSAELPRVTNVEDTDKVQSFRSNNAFMGVWGEEALIDFYYLSPRDMHFVRMRQKADAFLEPVVRIVMGTGLMLEFLEACRPFAERLSAEARTIEVK